MTTTEKILVLDTENTIWNKGSPFDPRNFNVCVAYKTDKEHGVVFQEYKKIKQLVDECDIIVFFNAKYDIHWLRKINIDVREKRIWCCQLFEFLHGRMQESYPSLNATAEKYGFGKKLDVIQNEYWDKGINTHEIPKDKLGRYAMQDVELTYKIYQKQKSIMRPHQKMLFRLSMLDLVVLADMEWNGSYLDIDLIKKRINETEKEIKQIQDELSLFHNVPDFNWNSGDHLSALLYGGVIEIDTKEPDGVYKSGQKKGQLKYKKVTKQYHLPRLFKPLKGSELKKEGKWSTEEQILVQLSSNNKLVEGILKLKKLNKLVNTYYRGLLELYSEKNWTNNLVHTTFNQCVARTGRLSSASPNLQNLPDEAQELFTSRW